MAKCLIEIDTEDSIQQLNNVLPPPGEAYSWAIIQLLRYIKGINSKVNMTITTRDSSIGGTTANMIVKTIAHSQALTSLIGNYSFTGSSRNVQVPFNTPIFLQGGSLPGSNSSFTGNVPIENNYSALLTVTANQRMSNDIYLYGDGVSTINELLIASNNQYDFTANPNNLIIANGFEIPVLGGSDPVFASFDGDINIEGGGTGYVSLVANTEGVSYNITITGDGVTDISNLVGVNYTVNSGGELILANGDFFEISGGLDGEFSTFDGIVQLETETVYVDITADTPGEVYKLVTGDGTSTINELVGAGFTIVSGGTSILLNGYSFQIQGGSVGAKASAIIQDMYYESFAESDDANKISIQYVGDAYLGEEYVDVVYKANNYVDIIIHISSEIPLSGTNSRKTTLTLG